MERIFSCFCPGDLGKLGSCWKLLLNHIDETPWYKYLVLLSQHLCRQGRESVQVTYELDVMATEYLEAEVPVQAGDVTREGVVRPVDVRNILKGRLHLRLASVGHAGDGNMARTGRFLPQMFYKTRQIFL